MQYTFDHSSSYDYIQCTLHVSWCIIEQEKALGKAICLGLKDPNGALNLFYKLLRSEVSVIILSRFEYNASLPAVQQLDRDKEKERK